MERGIGTYELPGSAATIALRDERKNEEVRQTQETARDTVTISDEARERLQAKESGETPDDARRQTDGKDKQSVLVPGDDGAEDGDPETKVQKLQRQIRDVQAKMAEATARLAEAKAKAQGDAAAQAAASGAVEQEVNACQTELTQLNQQLMRLLQQLQEAIKGGGNA